MKRRNPRLFTRFQILHSGAHRLGHQVRPWHRYLRHGLLRAPLPARQPCEEPQVEGGKGGLCSQAEEGQSRQSFKEPHSGNQTWQLKIIGGFIQLEINFEMGTIPLPETGSKMLQIYWKSL